MFQRLIAGDTLDFTVEGGDYPPSAGWALSYRLVPRTAGNPVITLAATTVGSGYRVQASAATTANWAPDTYTWTSFADGSAGSYTVSSGQITVVPNPRATAAGFDDRTQEEIDLEAVNAAIRARMTGGAVAEYAIRDRSLKYMTMTDLHAERSRLAVLVKRQRRAKSVAAGLGKPGRLGVRFG